MKRYTIVSFLLFSLCAVASAGPIATSTFDTDADGWVIVTTLQPTLNQAPTWTATGGNPGGFIYGVDPDTGSWGFLAPDKFLNDISDAYGQTLSFDIAAYYTPDNPAAWVGVQGAGYQFVCEYTPPASNYPAWYSRSVTMTETAGWFDPDTLAAPTYTQWMAVLNDLDALVITAEFAPGLGNDISGLDNVILVPEPASLLIITVAGIPFIRRRR